MTPDLAVVIVSFNGRDDLMRCLASIPASAGRLTTEVVVVDNGSTDGGPALVRERFPDVRVLEQAENRGFAAGCNVGIRASSAALVLLLNPDTVPPADAIERLAQRLTARPEVAIAGPRLVDADGRPELSFGSMISPVAELRQKVLGGLHARGVRPAAAYVQRWTSREHDPDWVSGACLLVRRADAVAVGLLDERFFLYTEDVDFCAAVRARGRRVLFTPAAEVRHLRGRSRASTASVAARRYRESQLAFYAKHHPGWLPWLRAYLRLGGQLPR
jgi:hypothetical protein